jgi:hypothetical protein
MTTPIYLDNGFYVITPSMAKTFGCPRLGYEKLVTTNAIPTTNGTAWLARTVNQGQQVWTLRDAGSWRAQ